MGVQRRHEGANARRKDNALAELTTLAPLSLPLEATGELRRAPEPVPVVAWVQIGTRSARVQGSAIAWNADAVEVQWVSANADEARRAVVWASAVRRVES